MQVWDGSAFAAKHNEAEQKVDYFRSLYNTTAFTLSPECSLDCGAASCEAAVKVCVLHLCLIRGQK